MGKIGITCRQPFLGADEWIEEDLKKASGVEEEEKVEAKKEKKEEKVEAKKEKKEEKVEVKEK